MGISNTSFVNSYQQTLGIVYSDGVNDQINPTRTLQNFVASRQFLLQGLSSSEVSSALAIINAHLASETTYVNANANIIRGVIQSLSSFYNTVYDNTLRDFFIGIAQTVRVPWQNSFKEAFYQATNTELVQQIGFASWNGTDFVVYPPSSSTVNKQNSVSVASTSSSANIVITGFNSNISDFALPGDYIISSSTGSMPPPSLISFSTTVVGYANTNTLILSNSLSLGPSTTLFSFRPLKGNENLEFRFGTAGATGSMCTNIFSNVVLNVTLTRAGSTSTAINVSISTASSGRVSIGVANNSVYKAIGISSILISSGSVSGFGTNKLLEIWVKGTN